MNPELIQAWAAMINALAWPIAILVSILLFLQVVLPTVRGGGAFRFKWRDIAEVTVEPAQGFRPPSNTPQADQMQQVENIVETRRAPNEPLPLDYFFLNHTSFLRPDKQEEFCRRTGVLRNHYDIRVIVDSYYRGALDRVEYVEYVLHRSYPQPVQYRRNRDDKFLLKELANGEYVLMAKVYLKDRKEPVLLQRYITLWESGPRLP